MIHSVAGTIIEASQQSIVVSCGPMSFSFFVPRASGYQAGMSVTLYTYLQWNQEQGPSLFGFATQAERVLFEMILGCSGIGPKIGLAILDQMSPSEFVQIVQTGDQKGLSKVNGIGAKKAEQMLVQLRHKVEKLINSDVSLPIDEGVQSWGQITQVLQSLNYTRPEINAAMDHLRSHAEPTTHFDQLVRSALSFLSKKQ